MAKPAVDWSGSAFQSFEFDGSRMGEPDTSGKEFDGCSFRQWRPSRANFSRALIIDSTFEDCDMSLLSCVGTRFRSVRFVRCKLLGIDWSTSEASPIGLPFSFDQCTLDDSSFVAMRLSGVEFASCKLRRVDFSDADLSKAVLRGSECTDSRFGGADLSKADLREATGYMINPTVTRVGGLRVSLPDAVALLEAIGIEVDLLE